VFTELKLFIGEPSRIETYMCGFKIDPYKTGLRKTLKEYEELALRFIWEIGEKGAGSGITWRTVNERLAEGKTISRASIIFFLNRMVDQGARAPGADKGSIKRIPHMRCGVRRLTHPSSTDKR
jgi:hypothetical protein